MIVGPIPADINAELYYWVNMMSMHLDTHNPHQVELAAADATQPAWDDALEVQPLDPEDLAVIVMLNESDDAAQLKLHYAADRLRGGQQ